MQTPAKIGRSNHLSGENRRINTTEHNFLCCCDTNPGPLLVKKMLLPFELQCQLAIPEF